MSETEKQETQFTERMSNFGFFFLISGLLTFFGLQNYAPFSYFAYLEFPDVLQSFFNPAFSWFVFVIVWILFPLSIAFRFIRINKEIENSQYKRFSILFLVSVVLQFLSIIVLLSLSFLPWSLYYAKQTEIGMGYLSANLVVQILQIIAWGIFYNLSCKTDTDLGKDIQLNFGGVPILFLIGNVIAIGAYVISYISSTFFLTGNPVLLPTSILLAMLGTYVHFGWIGFTMLGNIIVGIRILNKPTEKVPKTFASRRVQTNKVKQSCPICRYTIYEGQDSCPNCGYRV